MKKAFLLFSLLFILCSSIFPYGGKFEKKSYNDSITLELCESSSSRCTFRIKNFEINKKTYISFYRQDESFQRMQVKVDSKSIGYYNPFEKLLTFPIANIIETIATTIRTGQSRIATTQPNFS